MRTEALATQAAITYGGGSNKAQRAAAAAAAMAAASGRGSGAGRRAQDRWGASRARRAACGRATSTPPTRERCCPGKKGARLSGFGCSKAGVTPPPGAPSSSSSSSSAAAAAAAAEKAKAASGSAVGDVVQALLQVRGCLVLRRDLRRGRMAAAPQPVRVRLQRRARRAPDLGRRRASRTRAARVAPAAEGEGGVRVRVRVGGVGWVV